MVGNHSRDWPQEHPVAGQPPVMDKQLEQWASDRHSAEMEIEPYSAKYEGHN